LHLSNIFNSVFYLFTGFQFMITVAVRTKTSIKFSELNNKTLVHTLGPERVVDALDSSYFVKPDRTTHSFQ